MTKRISKRLVWLKHFLDESNSATFLNKQESARAAKYKANSDQRLAEIGYQNSIILQPTIAKWLDEIGLSENALKEKLHQLVNARQTKFFQKDGLVTDTREVAALEVQRKSVDMGFKIHGTYSAEKREHTGKDGGPIAMTDFPAEPKTIAEWEAMRNEAEEKRKAKNEKANPMPTVSVSDS